ncbi:unnamed protein product [Linum tenue]|uniref:Uncharacterized protein n=1 Tax=Linum tenue TaxID=586396 RepID=A0AAV0RMS9_9ROSI|nr:unnamed protein product [Linum tenue]
MLENPATLSISHSLDLALSFLCFGNDEEEVGRNMRPMARTDAGDDGYRGFGRGEESWKRNRRQQNSPAIAMVKSSMMAAGRPIDLIGFSFILQINLGFGSHVGLFVDFDFLLVLMARERKQSRTADCTNRLRFLVLPLFVRVELEIVM